MLIDSDFIQYICTVNIAEISWGTKTVSIGWPELIAGDFKFTWDIPNRELTYRNSIQNLGPSISYEDTSQNLEISATFGNLQNDYSKIITVRWYEQNGQIIGIYLDTSDSYLAQLAQVEVIKGTSGNNGKKIAIYGLQCDQCYIKKVSDQYQWGGSISVANHLIFSKLYNNQWKNLDIQWNFQDQEKWIIFQRDPEFDLIIELFSAEILGFTIVSEIDLLIAEYIEIKWDIGVIGKVSIDSNWEYITSISFLVGPYQGIGLDITINALRAQNWWVSWTAWPPANWNVQTSGTIQSGAINIDVYYNGDWYHLWPWI